MTPLATATDHTLQPSARDVATPAARAALKRCIDRISLLLQHAIAARDGLGDTVGDPASGDPDAPFRASSIRALLAADLPRPRPALLRPAWVRLYLARLEGGATGPDPHRAALFFGQLERWRTTAPETEWYRRLGAVHDFTSDDFAIALALDWLPRSGIVALAFADALSFGNPARRTAFLRALGPSGAVVRAGLVSLTPHPLAALRPAPAVIAGLPADTLTSNLERWLPSAGHTSGPTGMIEPAARAVREALVMTTEPLQMPGAWVDAAGHLAELLAFVPTTGLSPAGMAAVGDALEAAVALATELAPDLLPPAIAQMIAILPRHAANDPALRAAALCAHLLRAAADGGPHALDVALAARDFAAAHGLRTHAALACGIAAHQLAPTAAATTPISRRLDLEMFHLAAGDRELAHIAAARLLDPLAIMP